MRVREQEIQPEKKKPGICECGDTGAKEIKDGWGDSYCTLIFDMWLNYRVLVTLCCIGQ